MGGKIGRRQEVSSALGQTPLTLGVAGLRALQDLFSASEKLMQEYSGQ